jgi:hypothetical protein
LEGVIEVCLKNIKIFIEVSKERFKQNLKNFLWLPLGEFLVVSDEIVRF